MKYLIKRIDTLDMYFGVAYCGKSNEEIDALNKVFGLKLEYGDLDRYTGMASQGSIMAKNGKQIACTTILLIDEYDLEYGTICHEISHIMDDILNYIFPFKKEGRCEMSSLESELKAGLVGFISQTVFDFLNKIEVKLYSTEESGWVYDEEKQLSSNVYTKEESRWIDDRIIERF